MKNSFFLFVTLLCFDIARAQVTPRANPNAANLPVTTNNVIALVQHPVIPVTIVNEPCPPAYNKIWMQKNLDVTTYRNGDPIPEVKDLDAWSKLTSGAWCYYNNDPANGKIYGKLYNWYAVNDPRGLAPEDWHIPSDLEWIALFNGLGGVEVAGGKMKNKATYWKFPNEGATNSSGFEGLPAGFRVGFLSPGKFTDLGTGCIWWTSTEGITDIFEKAWCAGISNTSGRIYFSGMAKKSGYSVRCIKD